MDSDDDDDEEDSDEDDDEYEHFIFRSVFHIVVHIER